MSTFRFYITDLFNGEVVGTNDEQKATDMAMCEDYFVIEPATNSWWNGPDREATPIKEFGHD